jgi:hypothetical protein
MEGVFPLTFGGNYRKLQITIQGTSTFIPSHLIRESNTIVYYLENQGVSSSTINIDSN